MPFVYGLKVELRPLKKAQVVAPFALSAAIARVEPGTRLPVMFKAGKPCKLGADPSGQLPKKGVAKVTIPRGPTGVSKAAGNGDSPFRKRT